MKSDGYAKYVCDKCGKTAYVAAGDTEAREWFTVRRYSAGKATRIADDVAPDIYELCSQCNASFMAFMQQDDASFEAWLKEVEQ